MHRTTRLSGLEPTSEEHVDKAWVAPFQVLAQSHQWAPPASIDDLKIATVGYVDWFNHRRMPGEIGLIPPAEHEANHGRENTAPVVIETSLPSFH